MYNPPAGRQHVWSSIPMSDSRPPPPFRRSPDGLPFPRYNNAANEDIMNMTIEEKILLTYPSGVPSQENGPHAKPDLSARGPNPKAEQLKGKSTAPFLRRFTSKLRLAAPSPSTPRASSTQALASVPLESAFTSKELRDAALRERGLLAQDLSQQERARDESLPAVAPNRWSIDTEEEMSAAERIKAAWEAKNREAQSGPLQASTSWESQTGYVSSLEYHGGHTRQFSDMLPAGSGLSLPVPTRFHVETAAPVATSSQTVVEPAALAFTGRPVSSNSSSTSYESVGPCTTSSHVLPASNSQERRPELVLEINQQAPIYSSLIARSPVEGSIVRLAEEGLVKQQATPTEELLSIFEEHGFDSSVNSVASGSRPDSGNGSAVARGGRSSFGLKRSNSAMSPARGSSMPPSSRRGSSFVNMHRSTASAVPSMVDTSPGAAAASSPTASSFDLDPYFSRRASPSYRPLSPVLSPSASTYSVSECSSATAVNSQASSGRTLRAASLRRPVDPTIHNRSTIMRQARGIEDAEVRRLSEMAFLS